MIYEMHEDKHHSKLDLLQFYNHHKCLDDLLGRAPGPPARYAVESGCCQSQPQSCPPSSMGTYHQRAYAAASARRRRQSCISSVFLCPLRFSMLQLGLEYALEILVNGMNMLKAHLGEYILNISRIHPENILKASITTRRHASTTHCAPRSPSPRVCWWPS